jgi:hypothetical protein
MPGSTPVSVPPKPSANLQGTKPPREPLSGSMALSPYRSGRSSALAPLEGSATG